ncbi:Matrix metalloproteinase-20 [Lamellibrachia satsuma]|nr:Matrix metalloproteinase-20 [Lamellibrachia satsuma]
MLLRVSLLALCALCANLSQGAPTTGDVDYMAYLTRYKYLRANNPDPRIASLTDSLKEAIKSFQHMAGVPITGVMDKATRYAMFLPRCGVPDVLNMGGVARKRKRRFVTQGSRWSSNHLTYKISKYTSDMSKDVVDAEIRRALNVWASVTPLTFTQKDSGKVDIEIKFVRGEHGDGNPFDGPRGTLAHAFFPQYGGDAHFDEDEAWVFRTGKTGSINLFQVAAHEFGHSLGLAHTDVNTALMAPLYRGYEPNFTLDPDDISGIQRIYGSKTKTSPAAPTKRITTTTSSTTTTTTTPTTTTTTQSTTKPIPEAHDQTFDDINSPGDTATVHPAAGSLDNDNSGADDNDNGG